MCTCIIVVFPQGVLCLSHIAMLLPLFSKQQLLGVLVRRGASAHARSTSRAKLGRQAAWILVAAS